MSGYSINEWIVAWTPKGEKIGGAVPGAIKVDRLGSETYWNDQYAFVTGCCETVRHTMSLPQKIMMMFIDFHTIVVRDGIVPQAAHREFLKIDEYRRRISPDTEGGDPE